MFIKKSILGIVLLMALPVVASESSFTELSGTQTPELGSSFAGSVCIGNHLDNDPLGLLEEHLDLVVTRLGILEKKRLECESSDYNWIQCRIECLTLLKGFLKSPGPLTHDQITEFGAECSAGLRKIIETFYLKVD